MYDSPLVLECDLSSSYTSLASRILIDLNGAQLRSHAILFSFRYLSGLVVRGSCGL